MRAKLRATPQRIVKEAYGHDPYPEPPADPADWFDEEAFAKRTRTMSDKWKDKWKVDGVRACVVGWEDEKHVCIVRDEDDEEISLRVASIGPGPDGNYDAEITVPMSVIFDVLSAYVAELGRRP